MSTIYGFWNKSDTRESCISSSKLIDLNKWWNPSFLCRIETKQSFLGGSYLDVEKPRLANVHLRYKHLYIIADARLDNREELKKKLGGGFDQDPDITLIARSYLEYGEDCPLYLKGAFSFVIHDTIKDQFFCAVDRIGIKPLYYFNNAHYFLFGTQKKSVLSPASFDRSANWNFLTKRILSYVHKEEDTEYANVHRLPPGSSIMVGKNESLVKKRFWSLDTTKEISYAKDSDYEEHFEDLITKAVKYRMRGVSKIGTHLSGGLDSSGIAGVAASLSDKLNVDLEAFAYTVPAKFDNEKLPYENVSPLIESQIQFANIKTFNRVDKKIFRTLKESIETQASWIDGFSELNKLNTEFEMMHSIQSRNIRVNLSGFLGDELVSSFTRAFYLDYLNQGEIVKFLFPKIESNISRKEQIGVLGLKLLSKSGFLDSAQCAQLYHNQKYKVTKRKKMWKNHLFNLDYMDEKMLNHIYNNEDISGYLYGFPFSLKEYQKNHIHRRISSTRIEGENMAGLNFHVQYRYPLADVDLLEYVLAIPVDQKIRLNQNRSIYRRSMKKYTHPDILSRDVKFGSIKPMITFYKEKTFGSLIKLYKELKEKNCLPFLNITEVEKFTNNRQTPPLFNEYLMYGELIRQGKMKI